MFAGHSKVCRQQLILAPLTAREQRSVTSKHRRPATLDRFLSPPHRLDLVIGVDIMILGPTTSLMPAGMHGSDEPNFVLAVVLRSTVEAKGRFDQSGRANTP